MEHAATPVTQHEFLSRLLAGIASLPSQRIQEIEDDIRRHFDEGRENGEGEQALAEKLGDPEALAKEYTILYLEDMEGTQVTTEPLRTVRPFSTAPSPAAA
ncbi:DUF1700 domain-containing protein [Ruminococcaceae bacterium OttesenSCG-928-L11]|nr:DUF1700 domain-containing protein [Ruminococcaceae bacterium OttesenSCG-928-L11]